MPLKPVAPIQATRVTVRTVSFADLADLMEVNGDDEVTRFLPYASWRSADDAGAWLTRMDGLVESGTASQLVIEHRASRKAIGTVLLFKYDEPSARVELGYVLGRSWWRQGLAKEAVAATCDHAFCELGMRRIEAEVNPANEASNALLRGLGFVHEGVLRQRWSGRQGTYDSNYFGCLAGEWRAPGCTAQESP
jgi:RimJ/RimL family protein N-acetyltransferase